MASDQNLNLSRRLALPFILATSIPFVFIGCGKKKEDLALEPASPASSPVDSGPSDPAEAAADVAAAAANSEAGSSPSNVSESADASSNP
jgi:hypothetical protein